MDRLKGKVAIITGAAGGICHKASELFCQEGAKVVMVDIDPQVEQFSAEINANGGESIAVVADVAQRDTWVQLKKLADAKYGRIDTVVNGAAAFSPPTHDWAHITSEMIEDVMRVNIDSMLYSYQTVLRYMMKKEDPRQLPELLVLDGAGLQRLGRAGLSVLEGVHQAGHAEHGQPGQQEVRHPLQLPRPELRLGAQAGEGLGYVPRAL